MVQCQTTPRKARTKIPGNHRHRSRWIPSRGFPWHHERSSRLRLESTVTDLEDDLYNEQEDRKAELGSLWRSVENVSSRSESMFDETHERLMDELYEKFTFGGLSSF